MVTPVSIIAAYFQSNHSTGRSTQGTPARLVHAFSEQPNRPPHHRNDTPLSGDVEQNQQLRVFRRLPRVFSAQRREKTAPSMILNSPLSSPVGSARIRLRGISASKTPDGVHRETLLSTTDTTRLRTFDTAASASSKAPSKSLGSCELGLCPQEATESSSVFSRSLLTAASLAGRPKAGASGDAHDRKSEKNLLR